MYSLNVPVPGAVSEQAWALRSHLTDFELLRDEHTLVVKRLDARTQGEFAAVERAVRDRVRGTAPFEVEVDGIDVFTSPPAGPAPVIFFAVDSPGMVALHRDLVEDFGAVEALEGDEYRPHITLARGGNPDALDAALEIDISPMSWTVERLIFWDATRELPAGEIPLPA